MVAPVPYGLQGLRRRQMPVSTAPAPGRGLAYKPLNPLQSLAGGSLRGIGQLLVQLGVGRPDLAGQAFSSGLDQFNEGQRQNEADAQNREMFGLQLEDRQTAINDRADEKAAAAQAKADRDSSIDMLVQSGLIDPAAGEALKTGVGGLGDFVQKPDKPTDDIREYNLYVEQGGKDNFTDWMRGNKRAGASSQTTIVNAGDKENAKTIGKYWGEKLGEIMDTGFAAPKTIAKYQRLGALLDQAGSGTFTKSGVEFKKALKGAGIDPEAFGITDNTAPADAAEAITNQLAMEMRNPSGGAGMPGAMSDSDRVFLQNTVANLGKTPEGNRMIIEAAVKMAQRDQEVAKMANDYATKHGGIIDGGFFDELQKWSEANPMFAGMGGGGRPVVVDGYTVEQVQ